MMSEQMGLIEDLRLKIDYATEKCRDKHVCAVEDLQGYLTEIERLRAMTAPMNEREIERRVDWTIGRDLERKDAEIARLQAVLAPFMRYYDDIRFNLRKQPRPTDAAIEERGERVACVTWAEFYALSDALNSKRTLNK